MMDKFAGYDASITEDLIGRVVVNQEGEYVMDDGVVDVMKELGVSEKTTRRTDMNKGTEDNSAMKSRWGQRFRKEGWKGEV